MLFRGESCGFIGFIFWMLILSLMAAYGVCVLYFSMIYAVSKCWLVFSYLNVHL